MATKAVKRDGQRRGTSIDHSPDDRDRRGATDKSKKTEVLRDSFKKDKANAGESEK